MSSEIRRIGRHARRGEKFPPGAKCSNCSETDPVVLVEGSDPIVCYECQAKAGGRSGLEADHFAGAANSPITMLIPANIHRLHSDEQQDWPRTTLANRNGNPLLKLEAILRGWLDYLQIVIDAAKRVPDALHALDGCLTDTHGPRWWEEPQFLAIRGCMENA